MGKVNGMQSNFNIRDINAVFDAIIDQAEDEFILLLKRAGEEFVVLARENGAYIDHTGNLRSSIGYVIVQDGTTVFEDFQQSDKQGTDKKSGVDAARRLSYELAKEYSPGIYLIGVAGMQYAAAVEAKGKDVISLSADKVDNYILDLAKRLFDRLSAK